jgi:hypothetical protein
MMIELQPTHAIRDKLARVLMLLNAKPKMAAMATKMAVQAACVDKAFSAIDMLKIPDPATKMKTAGSGK